MDRQRTRSAFTLCFILTIYLLNSNNARNSHISNSQVKKAPLEKFNENFEGHQKSPESYITLHYDQSVFYKFKLKKYSDEWKTKLQCSVLAPSFEPNKTVFFNQSGTFNVSRQDCFPGCKSINYTLSSSGTFETIKGKLSCFDSEFSFSLSKVNKDLVYRERMIYGLLVTFLYILVLSGIMRHYRDCLDSDVFASQTSVFTLGMIMLYELTFALWQIKKSFDEDVALGVEYMLIAAFWGFLIFMIIYSRILFIVFQASEPGTFRIGEITNSQSKVFFLVLIGTFVMNFFPSLYYVWIIFLQMPFFPQIIQNSIYGYKKSISLATISLFTFSRTTLSAYFLTYPSNVIKCKPNLFVLSIILFILTVQFAVLYWQRSKPRFLVPKRYRPFQYEYFMTQEKENQLRDQENICHICMTHLNIADHPETVNFSKTMHTPCGHRYHQDCLLQWINIKLECPTCRAKLPEYEEI